jgi:hypothetical protein
MEANASNQLQTSPNLEPKRAKYTVKDVNNFLAASPALQSCVRSDVDDWPLPRTPNVALL